MEPGVGAGPYCRIQTAPLAGVQDFLQGHALDEPSEGLDPIATEQTQRQNFRRMHFAFPGRPPVDQMTLPGVRKTHVDGHVFSLTAGGHLKEISARASALGAISASIQPVSLRELFLDTVCESEEAW